MGRKAIEINPKSGERLRQIRKEKGITLEKLAELTHYTAAYLSQVETGKKPLSLELENAVIRLFPEYRHQWLSGSDDFKTFADVKDFHRRAREKDREIQEDLLLALIRLLPYGSPKIERKEDGGIRIVFGTEDGWHDIVELNIEQTRELIHEIRAFVQMRIRWLFNPPFPGSRFMIDTEILQGGKENAEEQ